MNITIKIEDKDLETAYPLTGEKSWSLKDFQGENLVIYFYPKDHTPGCTKEGRDFTKLHKEFLKYNTEIIGVSRDGIKSHESFKAKQGYSFDLLSDKEGTLCNLFKVFKKVLGKNFITRSTFVLDSKSQVIYEERGVKVSGHAEKILEFIKEQSS